MKTNEQIADDILGYPDDIIRAKITAALYAKDSFSVNRLCELIESGTSLLAPGLPEGGFKIVSPPGHVLTDDGVVRRVLMKGECHLWPTAEMMETKIPPDTMLYWILPPSPSTPKGAERGQ